MAHLTDVPYIGQGNIDRLINDLNTSMYGIYGSSMEPFNMLIVGGAALAIKYNFRMTVDIDAEARFTRKIQDAIDMTARNNNIPKDWLNWGFMNTYSYSRRLWQNALPYKVFGYISVYVVSDLDQLCMKSVSGRKKDLGDIEFLVDKVCNQGYTYSQYMQEFALLYGDTVRVRSNIVRKVQTMFKKKKMFI